MTHLPNIRNQMDKEYSIASFWRNFINFTLICHAWFASDLEGLLSIKLSSRKRKSTSRYRHIEGFVKDSQSCLWFPSIGLQAYCIWKCQCHMIFKHGIHTWESLGFSLVFEPNIFFKAHKKKVSNLNRQWNNLPLVYTLYPKWYL